MPFRKDVVVAATEHLSQADPVLQELIRRVGPFMLKTHRDRFDLLVRSILSQQISTKAARTIRLRLADRVAPQLISPESLGKLTDPELRAIGLSAQKVSYLRDLSDHALTGKLQLHKLSRLDDETVIEQLVAVRGIGRWTAQMFLIFALGRLDVFPHDDLGVRSALKTLYALDDLPNQALSHSIAEKWAPYRSVATWYCWRMFDLKSDPSQDPAVYPV